MCEREKFVWRKSERGRIYVCMYVYRERKRERERARGRGRGEEREGGREGGREGERVSDGAARRRRREGRAGAACHCESLFAYCAIASCNDEPEQ